MNIKYIISTLFWGGVFTALMFLIDTIRYKKKDK